MAGYKEIRKKLNKDWLGEIWKEIKWMSVYAKKYKFIILFYSISGIVGTLMGLTGSLFTKFLIDTVTGYKTGQIGVTAALMVGVGVGNIIIKSFNARISAVLSTKVQNEIQADIFGKIMEADMEALNPFKSGDLLNRLNQDVGIVANCVTGWIPAFLARGVQFVGALIIILYYDPIMALIALVSAPISLVVSKILLRRMMSYNKKLKNAGSEIMAFENDVFQNIQPIKAFGVVNDFEEMMQDNLKQYRDLTLEYNKFSVITTAFMSFVGMFISYACLGWSVYRLWTGAIVFGTMTLFLQLASGLNNSFSALINLIPQAINAATSAGRIMQFEDIPKEKVVPIENEEEVIKAAYSNGVSIQFDNLGFSYTDGEKVLEKIDFLAEPGNIVALVGASGEGKTTFIRLLLGLINPTEGSAKAKINNKEICELSASTRKLFSYVPQGNTIFAGTVEDNLKMTKPNATKEQMEKALKDACAWEFVNKLPQGIKTELKERGKGLSEGQAQRIAIARALLKDAPIILLDEATSALDTKTEKNVLNNILKSNRKKTCIVTTHRPTVLSMCTSIYKIEHTSLIKAQEEK